MKPDPSDRLRHLLQEWQDVPASDAGLAARVLREVPAATTNAGAGAGRWQFALAGVALGVLLGVTAIEWRESRIEAARAAELPQRYLAWIDPQLGLAEAKP